MVKIDKLYNASIFSDLISQEMANTNTKDELKEVITDYVLHKLSTPSPVNGNLKSFIRDCVLAVRFYYLTILGKDVDKYHNIVPVVIGTSKPKRGASTIYWEGGIIKDVI